MSNLYGQTHLTGTVSLAGTLDFGGGITVQAGPGTAPPTLVLTTPPFVIKTLSDLVAAVKAGAPCRCFTTEVCPLCHDLAAAVTAAEKLIEAEKRLPYVTQPPTPSDRIYLTYDPSATIPSTGIELYPTAAGPGDTDSL